MIIFFNYCKIKTTMMDDNKKKKLMIKLGQILPCLKDQ